MVLKRLRWAGSRYLACGIDPNGAYTISGTVNGDTFLYRGDIRI